MSITLIGTARAYRRIAGYRVLSRSYFHLPVMVPFLLGQGFSLFFVFCAMALYGAVVAFLPIFIQTVSPARGIIPTLIVGEAFKIGGLLCLAFSTHWAWVLLGQIITGAGFCLTIGGDVAAASALRPSTMDVSRSESLTQLGMFLASFTAGSIGALSMGAIHSAPFFESALACALCIGLLIGIRLPEPEKKTARAIRAEAAPPDGVAPQPAWQPVQSYYAINRAVLLSLFSGLIPVLIVFDHPVPMRLFGLFLGFYTLGGLCATQSLRAIENRYGTRAIFLLTGLGSLGGISLLLAGKLGILVSLAMLGLAGGFIRPASVANLKESFPAPLTLSSAIVKMERVQSFVQVFLLLAAGMALQCGVEHRKIIVSLLVGAIVVQMFLFLSRTALSPADAP